MPKTIKQFEESLFNENDGSKFSKTKDKLITSFSETDREKVLEILTQYSKSGKILHWREFLMTDIIKLVFDDEKKYASFFEWAITQPKLTYWGIDGLLKTKGQKAYPNLIELAQDEKLSKEVRAKAIKSISVYSKQPFDKDLSEDPGYWKVEDLEFRIPELLEWQKSGYKQGLGYVEPEVHTTLKNPKTELEKVVAMLNKKLELERKKHQDLSNPSNWLVIADRAKINEIEKKWKLPENYLTFLKNYSPIRVFIESEEFFQGLNLYGADKLIGCQAGYSFNGLTGEVLEDWLPNFVVIADAGGDPYCIDIGNIKDNDAPIYTSGHGGEWEFEKCADTFIDFLKDIVNKMHYR